MRLPSTIALFCFEAMRRRSARSRTARAESARDRPVGARPQHFSSRPRVPTLRCPAENVLQDPLPCRAPRGARGKHTMRIAVVGATGNVGTEVLSALGRRPEVTSVLGIARRLPETSAQPYAGAEWAAVDIGAATTAQEATEQLTDALRGADAVIHLAWLIQPNGHRELLRRVNVEGTRHVAQAAVEAGVGTLVVASSVGAYSPSPGREARDESWPTTGVRTSHYSVDKVAQEGVLNETAAAHPGPTVTRVRPALIFQGEAGSEIQRYFLGGWMPVQLLRAGRPPLLPLPRGLRFQAVHAQDVAEVYAAAAVRIPCRCARGTVAARDSRSVATLRGRVAERPPGSRGGSTRHCWGCTSPITSPARPPVRRAPTGWRRTSWTLPGTRRCPRSRSRSAPSAASSSS